VAVRLDRWADAAAVGALVAARRIRSGALVASPAPAPAPSAAARAWPALLPMAEPRRVAPAPVALAVAAAGLAARPAPAALERAAAGLALAVAVEPAVDRAAPVDRLRAVGAPARAARFVCIRAAAGRLRSALRSPTAASVRPAGPTGLFATEHQHRGLAARSRHVRLPILIASHDLRRAVQRRRARVFQRACAKAAARAASSTAQGSFAFRPDRSGKHHHARSRRSLEFPAAVGIHSRFDPPARSLQFHRRIQ
jgi:hypothetical protein